MKNEFYYIIALMGLSDFIYKGQKEKWIYSWMNEKEILAYNIGWNYAKNQI